MSLCIAESHVQDAALTCLESLGHTVKRGPAIAPGNEHFIDTVV